MVTTDDGYTQPSPSACSNAPVPVRTNSVNTGQSAWVCSLGPCPLICAM